MMMSTATMFTGCEGDLEYPPMVEPVATIESNTKIADLKAMYWQETADYVTEVGQVAGEDIIIAGRVVSSDKTGNIYKNIVLQDNTGAITISINGYDLYETYQQGQQIVVNVTGLHIGGYVGLMQIGAAGTSNKGVPQTTFLDKDLFAQHAQQNGLARLERIDTMTVTIPEMMTAKGSVEGLQKWQSQLVRIDGVQWVDAGQPFAGSANANRYVKDANGNQINVRNSSYADFTNDILPTGTGSVVGILSYYNNDWQVLLNGLDGLYGFDAIEGGEGGGENGGENGGGDQPSGDSVPNGDGTQASPYNSTQILATGAPSTTEAYKTDVWVKGYIVGSIPSNAATTAVSATEFGTENASTTNFVIAPTANCKETSKCIAVQLPASVREALSLATAPGNLGKLVTLHGDIFKYCGAPGLKNTDKYEIEGGASTPDVPAGQQGTFKAVTTVTSGKSYVLVADGKLAKPISTSYGWLMAADVTVTNGEVSADDANAFVIESTTGGYTIKDAQGRYYYMKDAYNNFNADTTLPATGAVWTITFDNGAALITNVEMNKTVQFSAQHNSYGAYPDVQGTYPTLYEKN